MADGDGATDIVDLSGNGKGVALNVYPISGSPLVYDTRDDFPIIGFSWNTYVANNTEQQYRWDNETAAYVEISPSVGGAGDVEVPPDAYGDHWDNNFEVPTKNDVYDEMEALRGTGGASVDMFEYTFSAALTAPPANSQLRLNAVNPALVTEILASHLTATGFDPAVFFAGVEVGDQMCVQDKNEHLIFHRYDVTNVVTDLGTYSKIEVSHNSGSGFFNGGQPTCLAIIQPTESGFPLNLTIITEPDAARTLEASDAHCHIRFTNAAGCVCTIPPNADVPFDIGCRIRMTSCGAADSSVNAGLGVTLNSRGNKLTAAGQWAVYEVEQVAIDEWDIIGDMRA